MHHPYIDIRISFVQYFKYMSAINLDSVTSEQDLAMRLRLIRTERRVSLQEAAKAVGIHHTSLSRLELGQRDHMKVETLLRLARFYGLTIKIVEADDER